MLGEPLALEQMFAQPDNKGVWDLLRLCGPADVGFFETHAEGHPLDEGGTLFFHRNARAIPNVARYTVAHHNLLAHDRTARIFALHHGRATFALRIAPGEEEGFHASLRSETIDGRVDLRKLGEGWVIFGADSAEEEAAAYARAYQHAGR